MTRCRFLGAVVASRLSEIKEWNVLLLEAGGEETESSDVPLFAAFLQLGQLDWQYKTEPENNFCLGTIDSSLSFFIFIFLILENKKNASL